jgi:hypothetical protein
MTLRSGFSGAGEKPGISAPSGAGEKPGISVVWRLGSTLLEIPQLPPRVGVAPLGRARSAQPTELVTVAMN